MMRNNHRMPKYLAPFQSDDEECAVLCSPDKEQQELLDQLFHILMEYEDDELWECCFVVKKAISYMEKKDWCYDCELLIAELQGDLPLFAFHEQAKKKGV